MPCDAHKAASDAQRGARLRRLCGADAHEGLGYVACAVPTPTRGYVAYTIAWPMF